MRFWSLESDHAVVPFCRYISSILPQEKRLFFWYKLYDKSAKVEFLNEVEFGFKYARDYYYIIIIALFNLGYRELYM